MVFVLQNCRDPSGKSVRFIQGKHRHRVVARKRDHLVRRLRLYLGLYEHHPAYGIDFQLRFKLLRWYGRFLLRCCRLGHLARSPFWINQLPELLDNVCDSADFHEVFKMDFDAELALHTSP